LRGQQQLADAVQLIALAAPVAKGRLLGAAADLVDHGVGQPDGVEGVNDHPGVPRRRHLRAGVAAPGSSATVATWASQSRGRMLSQLSTAALVRSAITSSSRPHSRSTRPVTYRVGATRVALRKLVSSSPAAVVAARQVHRCHPAAAERREHLVPPDPRRRVVGIERLLGQGCTSFGELAPHTTVMSGTGI